MASKGFTFIDDFTIDDGNWTLIDATISGGVLNITANGGFGERYPDSDWYSGSTNDFIIEADFKMDNVDAGACIDIFLDGETNPLLFITQTGADFYAIYYDGAWRGTQAWTRDTSWHTMKVRRVGTIYYISVDGGTELSWDYGTARAISYIRLYMFYLTGDLDNFKYSWIKAVLEGAISFVGSVSKKQFKTLEGIISFIGTLFGSRLYKKLLEGAITFVGDLTKLPKKLLSGSITFVGTLQRKLTLHRLLEGSISFIGTLLGSRLYKKTLEGAISFIGTLSRKRTYRKILEGTISFIGTLKIRKLWSKLARAVASMTKLTRGSASMTKESRDAPSWTKEDR